VDARCVLWKDELISVPLRTAAYRDSHAPSVGNRSRTAFGSAHPAVPMITTRRGRRGARATFEMRRE
jgi:hypothetical protein